jgi:hypothetical protein
MENDPRAPIRPSAVRALALASDHGSADQKGSASHRSGAAQVPKRQAELAQSESSQQSGAGRGGMQYPALQWLPSTQGLAASQRSPSFALLGSRLQTRCGLRSYA